MTDSTSAGSQSALQRALIAWGNYVFHWRNSLFPVVIIVLFAGLRPVDAGGSPGADAWLDVLGVLVAVLGQVIRAAVVGLAYIKRGGVNKRVYADTLVSTGIFAHCRNPLYVGNACTLIGLFMIHNNPYAYVLGGVFFVVSYIAVVAAEEEYLRAKFGEQFDAYCRATPRWLPRLAGLGATLGSMRFNWRRVIIKEYSSASSWILTACALFAYQGLLRPGPAPVATLAISTAVAGLVLAAAIIISRLKKAGKLKE